MEPITLWRDVPVIEALLRVRRTGRTATPSMIAEEAVMHLADVYDSIAHLVAAGYVDIPTPDDDDATAHIEVVLSARLLSLVHPRQ